MQRFARLSSALVAVILLAVTPNTLLAQKDNPTPPGKKPAAGKVLTIETLGELLDAMGYEAKLVTLESGFQLYTVTSKQDTWTFYLEVSITRSGNNISLVAPLVTIGEKTGGKLPAPVMKKMLEANWELMPHAFVLYAKFQRVFMMRSLENRDITSARLKTALEDMFGNIRRTNDIWNPDRWGTAAEDGGVPKAPPKPSDDTKPDNTPEDITPQLTDAMKKVMAAAKAGDQAAVAAEVKKFMLPDADGWFRRVFGDAVGGKLAAEYTDTWKQSEASVVRLFLTAAEEEQNQIQVARFTKPDPDKATGNQNKALEAMKVKTPLYSVRLVKAGEGTGIHVYSFAAVDGKVRYLGKLRGIADSALQRPIAPEPRPAGVVPGEPGLPLVGLDAAVEQMLRDLVASPPAADRVSGFRPADPPFDSDVTGINSLLPHSTTRLTTQPRSTALPNGEWAPPGTLLQSSLATPTPSAGGGQTVPPAGSDLKNLLPPAGVRGFNPFGGPTPDVQPFSSLLTRPALPLR